ncbi:hypothetical protein VN12_00435 [Pirellula sp. SH-Sr6A]|nr:hypothetical protein VN12_00435 [Pirellula sp. SH-Sr6A]
MVAGIRKPVVAKLSANVWNNPHILGSDSLHYFDVRGDALVSPTKGNRVITYRSFGLPYRSRLSCSDAILFASRYSLSPRSPVFLRPHVDLT